MKKEIKKLTKQEKEKIENRLLAVFATALGAEMLLLYFNNWFQGQVGFILAARILIYSLLVGGIVGSVLLGLKSKKLKKTGQDERSLKYRNWYFVTLAVAISAFIIYPTEIITRVFGWMRLVPVGSNIVSFINSARFTPNPITSRVFLIMGLVGAYTIGAFIYYGIKTRKSYKASLNKGSK